MKTQFRFVAALLLALAGSVAQQSAHAYALFFELSPATNPVEVGSAFTLKVMLDDPSLLASADISLRFTGPVSFSNVAFVAFDGVPGGGLDLSVPGTPTIQLSGFAVLDGFPDAAPGPMTLASVDFLTTGTGSATFEITNAFLGVALPADPNSTVVPDLSDARLTVRVVDPTQKVPEPGSLALVGVAVAAAGLTARRRRAARSAA